MSKAVVVKGTTLKEKLQFVMANGEQFAKIPNFEMKLYRDGRLFAIPGREKIVQTNHRVENFAQMSGWFNQLTKGYKECILKVGDITITFKGGRFMASQKKLYEQITGILLMAKYGELLPEFGSDEYDEILAKVDKVLVQGSQTFLNYVALENVFVDTKFDDLFQAFVGPNAIQLDAPKATAKVTAPKAKAAKAEVAAG